MLFLDQFVRVQTRLIIYLVSDQVRISGRRPPDTRPDTAGAEQLQPGSFQPVNTPPATTLTGGQWATCLHIEMCVLLQQQFRYVVKNLKWFII